MDYFLKASAIIILFYACYKLFLQRETYFQSNRWFLLVGLFTAMVLPLVTIPIYIEYTPIPIAYVETTEFSPQQLAKTDTSFDYWSLLPYLYGLGLAFFFTRLAAQFSSLISLFKKHNKTKKEQFYFVETKTDIAPFSFFNRIVFNPKQFTEAELQHIITHEKIHAKQFHSLDVIITQIATVLFWFNPFIWWYKKELQQNLEFIADQKAQQQIDCAKSYQTVLLKASLSQNQLALSNNFYQSLIKKRIIMLQKSKSKTISYLKLVIVLPFLALFLMSVNVEEIYVAKTIVTENLKTETFTITSTSTDKQIDAIRNRLEILADNGLKIRFSDIKRDNDGKITNLAIETKLKGKSKFNHNVTYQSESGKPIDNILLKIENGELVFGDEKQDMVMKVTKNGVTSISSSKHKVEHSDAIIHTQNNGDTIKMNINSDDKESNSFTYKIVTEDTGGEKSKLIVTESGKKPLYVVDGKVLDTKNLDMNTETIASVVVLKGKKATEKYGAKGKDGVVEIASKPKNTWIIKESATKSKGDTIYFKINNLKYPDSISTRKVMIQNQNGDTNASNYQSHTINRDSFIVYIDGNKSTRLQMSQLKPNDIKYMSVLNGNNAAQAYGSITGNRVVEITTKDGQTGHTKYQVRNVHFDHVNDSIKINNSNKQSFLVNATFNDDSITKSSSMVTLPKTATDKSINAHKKFLKDIGIDAKINKLKRNKAGEIVKIKISLNDNKGQKSSATYQSDDGIPTVKYGIDMDGKLFISSAK